MARPRKKAPRKKVPREIKKAVLAESNGRCANPGCPNALPQLHHITPYHIIKTHDAKIMVAVCGACHDQIHRGELRINDDTLRKWKAHGKPECRHDTVHMEPGAEMRFLLGNIALISPNLARFPILDLTPFFRLSYRVEDGDILLVNLTLLDANGGVLFKASDNRFEVPARHPFVYRRQTGKHMLLGPIESILTPRLIDLLRADDPSFAREELYPVLDLEVTGLGELTVRGVWTDGERALVADSRGWKVISTPDAQGIGTIVGPATFRYTGPALANPFLQSVCRLF